MSIERELHKVLNLERPLVALDLETTSADITNARIVQIAYIKYETDGEVKTYNQFLNPKYPISSEASEVHGITQKDVENEPTFQEIAENIIKDLVNVDFAGYNVVFDLQILIAEFSRIKVKFHTVGANIIDGFKLWIALRPRTLSDAVREFTDDIPKDAHDALADIEMTMRVIKGQLAEAEREHKISYENEVSPVKQLGKMGFPSMVDLAGKFGRDEEGQIIFQFGKHKGLLAKNFPDFLHWMLRSDFSLETKWWTKKILSS